MGRKIVMKKIEDVTRCQVTFSKRRSSLMKKANELAVCCDIDVAFVAFSPSGRVSKFCNHKRIEDVLHRYVNLPADRRLNQISNVQGKMEKLKQLSHINGETSKLHFIDKQIENLELQIKKKVLELQIMETDLRDYEVVPGQEHSLHQLSWCERNLNQSLQRVVVRKMEHVHLESQSQNPFPIYFNQNEQLSMTQNPILMQLDPWNISPYGAQVGEGIFQGVVHQAKNEDLWLSANTINLPISSNISNCIPIQESLSEQSLMMDQPSFNFHDENNVNALTQSLMMDEHVINFHDPNNVRAHNITSVVFSDAIHMSSQSLCNIQDPRSIATTNPSTMVMPQPLYDEMGAGLQCINSDVMSQFSKMEDTTIFSSNTRYDNIVGGEDMSTINVNKTRTDYQPDDAYSNLIHQKEAHQDAQHVNLLFEDIHDDHFLWTTSQQKTSLGEWEDLLRDENP